MCWLGEPAAQDSVPKSPPESRRIFSLRSNGGADASDVRAISSRHTGDLAQQSRHIDGSSALAGADDTGHHRGEAPEVVEAAGFGGRISSNRAGEVRQQ